MNGLRYLILCAWSIFGVLAMRGALTTHALSDWQSLLVIAIIVAGCVISIIGLERKLLKRVDET